jgi:hypothetical protein
MRIHLLFAALTSATLALFAFSLSQAQAGSFFGPCCYGANYTARYPNRSHNVFGCGPCTQCKMWHPFFPRLRGLNQNGVGGGVPVNAMPAVSSPLVPNPAAQATLVAPSGKPAF